MTAMTTGIFLQSNALSRLPTEIGQLTILQDIYTFSNSISSTIPTQIGAMTQVTTAFFQSNSLQGSIPTQIGSLRKLTYLVLDNNVLDSTLPATLCNLTNLQIFSAAGNSLSGRPPPCVFPAMQIFNLADNRFHGTLPSVLGWPRLAYLLLNGNKFHGSVSALQLNGSTLSSSPHRYPYNDVNSKKDYYGGNLLALTLHKNELDEPLPQDLALPRSLQTFTIFQNQIPGKVPHRLLAQVNGSKVVVLMSSNRLSCELPDWGFASDNTSVVLLGNLFSKDKHGAVPTWVPESERDTSFLSAVIWPQWSTFSLPPWLEILLQFLVALVVAVPMLATYVQPQSEGGIFIARCGSAVARFSVLVMPCLLLVVGLASTLGYSYFECGDALLKYTTFAYLADSPVLEGIASGFVAAYTVALAVLLARFVPTVGYSSTSSLREPLLPKDEFEVLSGLPSEGIDWTMEASEVNEKARRVATLQPQPRASMFGKFGAVILVATWLAVLLTIGGVPTVLYVLTYSLPKTDLIPEWLQAFLGEFLALYLTFVSSFVIPVITRRTAQMMLNLLRREPDKVHALQTIMAIIVRTLLIIVVPCLAVIVLSDGCYRGWTILWVACNESENSFTKSVDLEYYQYKDPSTYLDVYGSLTFELVTHQDVCPDANTFLTEETNRGTCGRSLLSVLGPVFIKKLVYAVLFSALEPAIWRAKRWLREKLAPLLPAWWVSANQPRRRCLAGIINDALTSTSEPDPMQRLVWFETALIFGALIPLLLPLLALQLYLDALVFDWLVHVRKTSLLAPALGLPVQRQAMRWHVVFVLALHCAMAAFFFVDGELHGRWVLVSVLMLVWTVFVAFQFLQQVH